MKTYFVIPHSCPSGLALRRQPEMSKPKFDYGFPPDGPSDSSIESAEQDFEQRIIDYSEHIASLEIIPIAIEYKEHWKIGDSVSENDFFVTWQSNIDVAIPKTKKQLLSDKYFLIKDLETKEFSIWTDAMVKIYRSKVEEFGVCPSISEIAEFTNDTEKLIEAKEEENELWGEIRKILIDIFYDSEIQDSKTNIIIRKLKAKYHITKKNKV